MQTDKLPLSTLYKRDTVLVTEYGKLEMEVTDLGECYLHLKVYKWNKQAMKQLKTLWPIVKKQLKESGYTCVRSIIPFSDKKAQRFQTFMGLEEDQVYYGKGFKTYKGEL